MRWRSPLGFGCRMVASCSFPPMRRAHTNAGVSDQEHRPSNAVRSHVRYPCVRPRRPRVSVRFVHTFFPCLIRSDQLGKPDFDVILSDSCENIRAACTWKEI
jgi:hypothetical protein